MNTPPLRPVTTPPPGRPGSLLKTARAARASFMMSSFDDGEPISSSAVKSAVIGAGAAANFLSAAMTKALMVEPRLHVGATRAGRLAVGDAERTAHGLALPEHGVAMAHQQDRRVAGACPVPDAGTNGVAETLIGQHLEADVVARKEAAQLRADRIDAGLVVGAAVDVHERRHEGDHGLALAGEPIKHRGFFLGERGHFGSVQL